ncbi:hypothetical protein ACQY0O_001961 [Thecaphora frezii]
MSPHSFLNPPDSLPPAVRHHVSSLLSSLTRAHDELGAAQPADYLFLDRPFSSIRSGLRAETAPDRIERLIRTYARATIAASLRTHCLTAFTCNEALQKAKQYDELLNRHAAEDAQDEVWNKFPLLGLVFSVKDCIHVAGHATTLGCSRRIDAIPSTSAWLVQQLESLGAILIAKTACPQAMVSNVTHSPLWGKVRSPLGADYEVGGSSGGEAALVAMGGSALGLGTDMGGSVRQPAALSELAGLKFASDTWPFRQGEDFVTGLPDTPVPATAPGLLARHWSTIQDVCDALKLQRRQDAVGAHDDDDAAAVLEGIKVAVSTYEASPEVAAAIRMLADSEGLGEVEDLTHRLLNNDAAAKWTEMWMRHATSRGFEKGLEMVGDDPVIRESMFTATPAPHPLSSEDQTTAQDDLATLVSEFSDTLSPYDFLLIPSYSYGIPFPSRLFAQLDKAELWLQVGNLLDWPAVSIPLPVPEAVRRRWRSDAEGDEAVEAWSQERQGQQVVRGWKEWRGQEAKKVRDVWTDQERLPVISVQVLARPGREWQLGRVVEWIGRVAQVAQVV